MATVQNKPKYMMLEALKTNVSLITLENDVGDSPYSNSLTSADFETISASASEEPTLQLSMTQTITVDAGDTIVAIVVLFPYDLWGSLVTHFASIRYPIVDVDGNGEYFPDGGSIDVTEFEVNLDDL